jgi:hypothetical protein
LEDKFTAFWQRQRSQAKAGGPLNPQIQWSPGRKNPKFFTKAALIESAVIGIL